MAVTFSEWKRKLLIGVLEAEESTGRENVELLPVCTRVGIEPNDEWLVRFINEADPPLGSGIAMFELYSFSLSEAGRHHAERLRQESYPKTLVERVTSPTGQGLINAGNFATAVFALVVAAIALFKASN